jgi:membrane protein implicated in regulation of membrane protease activity
MSNFCRLMLLGAVLALLAVPALAFQGMQGGAPANMPGSAQLIKGKVVETMNSGGYTYVCLEHDGQKSWAAMPQTEVKVGEEVEVGGGMVMHNFTSKTLNRTFESITFSGGIRRAAADAAPAAATPAVAPAATPTMPPGHPPMGGSAPAEAAPARPGASHVAGKVVETLEGGGYTYAKVEQDGKTSWVAVPPTPLSVGQEVEFVPGFVMNNFNSKALNRTFDAITFSGGVVKK